MGSFHKADRKKAKARVAFCGASGSGKTYSALILASNLGKKIALIDTERGSGELYSTDFTYDVAQISGNFDPVNYINIMKEAEEAGYDVIVIDSLSHAWEGKGGVLEKHDKAAASEKNSFTAWRTVTPQHNKLVDAILQSPCHIIATMRTKVEYNMIEDVSNGKKTVKPVKIGTKPIQREGLDYEFTIVFDLVNEGHIATASKDRTGVFDGKPDTITKESGKRLLEWLNNGRERCEAFSKKLEEMPNSIDEDEDQPPAPEQPPIEPPKNKPINWEGSEQVLDQAIRPLWNEIKEELQNMAAAHVGVSLRTLDQWNHYYHAVRDFASAKSTTGNATDFIKFVNEKKDAFITAFLHYRFEKAKQSAPAVEPTEF